MKTNDIIQSINSINDELSLDTQTSMKNIDKKSDKIGPEKFEKFNLFDKHKKTKTLSNLNLGLSGLNNKIESFRVDDEYYKKKLNINPLNSGSAKKETGRGSFCSNKGIINIALSHQASNNKKHFKKSSEFFLNSKISTMLNNDTKMNNKRKEKDGFNANKAFKLTFPQGKIKKIISDTKIHAIGFEKARCNTDLREETEEDESNNKENKNNKETSIDKNENDVDIGLEFNEPFKTDIFAEISQNNDEYKNLMNFDYNKANTSQITEENSMLNLSLFTEQFFNAKKEL